MKKKINKKNNYITLGIIYVITIIFVLYLASWYNTYKAYQKKIPVLRNIISEINPNEVDHYLMENPSIILYLCSSSDNECREFEENLKERLSKNDYQEKIIYVNLEEVNDKSSYLKELINKYNGKDFSIERTPCLIKISDGNIKAVEDGLNGALLTKEEALKFIDVNYKS